MSSFFSFSILKTPLDYLITMIQIDLSKFLGFKSILHLPTEFQNRPITVLTMLNIFVDLLTYINASYVALIIMWHRLVYIRDAMEKAMATSLQYSCLETLWTEGPGGLQSMGSLRVGHD